MTVTINGTTGIDKVQDGTIQAADLAVGVPSRSQLPAGTVLQVVQGSTNVQTVNATSTLATTTLSTSITPTSSTSKILVLVAMQGVGKTTSDTSVNFNLYKNGSNLIAFSIGNTAYNGTTSPSFPGSSVFNYLDSPATTSATTYAVYFCSNSNNTQAAVQWNSSVSTMTLVEIAA